MYLKYITFFACIANRFHLNSFSNSILLTRRSEHDYPSRYCWHRWYFTCASAGLHESRRFRDRRRVRHYQSKANEAADQWGVPRKHVFSSYNKMLEMDEIDTVSVCTYNQGHRRPTVAALNAGKHVFCEKPMAATSLMPPPWSEPRKRRAKSCNRYSQHVQPKTPIREEGDR